MISENPIHVTMPSLCPQAEYQAILRSAWESGILTHNGPLLQKLERELNNWLGTSSLVAVTNGTVALQIAIKALNLKGEIITTPFSWIATCSAIQWEGCTPVFVDIDEESLNIDPARIEAAITEKTVAIMPVHVFSNPCEIEKIQEIATRCGLKVIYDAAHAFGVNYKSRSVLEYGDISTTSFHSTKLFNTGEGGGCFSLDNEIFERIRRIRFFGHDVDKEVVEVGLNGKLTEVHAALGLANLPYLNSVLTDRRNKYLLYQSLLQERKDISWQKIDQNQYNFSYMPIIFNSEKSLLKVVEALNRQNVFPRRYFYPSLNTMQIFDHQHMPKSEDISKRIVCLPLYYNLPVSIIEKIASVIIKTLDD